MTIINVFYDFHQAPNRQPFEVIQELRIRYREWEGQPGGDQIKLHDVDPSSLPEPLPPFLRVQVLK